MDYRPSLAHNDVNSLINSQPKLILRSKKSKKLGRPKFQQHASDLRRQRLTKTAHRTLQAIFQDDLVMAKFHYFEFMQTCCAQHIE